MSNELKANIYAPKLPWNCWRVDELGSNVMQFLLAEEPYYNRWAQKWYEIFQFIFGNSGIRWNKGGDFAMDVDTLRRRNPAVSHKAQTNLARVIVEALGSFLYGSLPDWETEATDESSVMAKRMATIVEKVLDAYMQRLLMDDEFYVAAMILATYGQVGAMVSWRKNAGSIIEMPAWHKIKAPIFTNWMAPNAMTGGLIESIVQAMGSDGQPMFEERWEPKMDEMGRQIINKMFSGDVCVDILTPFEYRKTLGAYGLHRAKHMCRLRLLDYDDYLDEMSHVQGKTKFFNDIRQIGRAHV